MKLSGLFAKGINMWKDTVVPLTGYLTTILNGGNGTIPYSQVPSQSPYLTGYGDKNFLVSSITPGWGGSLYRVIWNGTSHVGNRLYSYNSLSGAHSGQCFDSRGFVALGWGNHNMSSTFRLRTLNNATTDQTSFISEFNYSGTAGANYPVVAIIPNPSVTNGYIGLLRSTTTGHYTMLKFTVDNGGIISNVTYHGSRGVSDPLLPVSGGAVIGNDGKIYITNNNGFVQTSVGMLSINQDGSSLTQVFPNTWSGAGIGYGISVDDAGYIYIGSGGNVILRSPWTGSNYGPLEVIAGSLSVNLRTDGALGVNRVANYTALVNNIGANQIGMVQYPSGGGAGFYRVLT